MTPEQWTRLTPDQQAQHVARFGPPPQWPTTTKRSSWAAVVAVTLGVVAWLTLFLPMSLPGLVFGCGAIVFGVVGCVLRCRTGLAVTGLLLGVSAVLFALIF